MSIQEDSFEAHSGRWTSGPFPSHSWRMFNRVFGGAAKSSRKWWVLESEGCDSNPGSPIYWLSNPSKALTFLWAVEVPTPVQCREWWYLPEALTWTRWDDVSAGKDCAFTAEDQPLLQSVWWTRFCFPAASIICWYSESTIEMKLMIIECVKIINQGPICTCIVLTSHLASCVILILIWNYSLNLSVSKNIIGNSYILGTHNLYQLLMDTDKLNEDRLLFQRLKIDIYIKCD